MQMNLWIVTLTIIDSRQGLNIVASNDIYDNDVDVKMSYIFL